jgi:hypothetical protein
MIYCYNVPPSITAETVTDLKEKKMNNVPFKTTPFGDKKKWPFYISTPAVSKVL